MMQGLNPTVISIREKFKGIVGIAGKPLTKVKLDQHVNEYSLS